jgi:UDP-GlcNAc3NAcA epimerase
MKKIVTVIGARPQFIKVAPVSKAFKATGQIEEVLVHTGQHYDAEMSSVFFKELNIPAPRYNLEVGSGSHAHQTGEIMKRLENVLISENPELLLIYGDTNSTVAGALTASKLHIPVAHIEAGLRSFNRKMPEEINRIIADVLSSYLFAPTNAAIRNLTREGITKNVFKTGDVMYDAAIQASQAAERISDTLKSNELEKGKYILSTIHRAENTDDPQRLHNIFTALSIIAKDIPVMLPLHPRTRKMVDQQGLEPLARKIKVIQPVGFLDMVRLESNARLIVTDSGGVQKEAYFHRVPCITLRDQTEWVETVSAGWNTLADVNNAESVINLMREKLVAPLPTSVIEEYGDGDSAGEIAGILIKHLLIDRV